MENLANSSFECGSADDIIKWRHFEWLVEGILFSIVGIIGFLGNTLSILVLISPQLWKYTFNRLLVALAVFDLIFVMVTVPIHTFAVFEYSNWFFAAIYSRFLYPLSSISLSASIFMTVSITVERYWAVCRPTEYRNAGLIQNKNIRVAKYLVPVIFVSVLLNVPKFLETSVAYDEETGEVEYNISSHRRDPTFIWYYTIFYSVHPLITTELGPIVILTSLNIIIFKTISKNKRRFALCGGGRGGHGEMNLARIILNIVAVFVVCHIPRSILAIIAVVTVDTPVMCMELYQQYYPPAYLLYSESVSHLLLLTNSSVNFLIYCVVATRFRVFIKRRVMCNDHDVTNGQPIGVARLVTAPLIVMSAVPMPDPLAILPRRRCDSSSCSDCDGDCQCYIFENDKETNISENKEDADLEMVTVSNKDSDETKYENVMMRERSQTVLTML